MTGQNPPPGWYQRGESHEHAWWDGRDWHETADTAENAATTPPETAAPPGWFATDVPGERRWWDGQQWTEHRVVPDVTTRQVAGATVSNTTLRRIKWAGIHWGSAPPGPMLTLGIILVVMCSVPLFITVFMFLMGSGGGGGTAVGIAILLLFIFVGVVFIVEAYFGLKVRKLQREHPTET